MKKVTPQVKTRKKMTGTVVSDKMDKTVVVKVSRYVAHKKYGKYFKIDKRFKAHDENNEYKVGDRVVIEETRPMSKDKNFVVLARA
jgi:small subunit ribosomal protein S17